MKKYIVGLFIIASLFVLRPVSVKAVTIEELQAKINSLTAEVSYLKAKLSAALIYSTPTSVTDTYRSPDTLTTTTTPTVTEGVGSIRILKDNVPNGVETFNFTGTGPILPFILDDNGNNFDLYSNLKLHSSLPATSTGVSYTITEAAASSYYPPIITCSSYTGVTISGHSVTIKLTPNVNISCTFTNRKNAETGETGTPGSGTTGSGTSSSDAPLTPITGTVVSTPSPQPVAAISPSSAKIVAPNIPIVTPPVAAAFVRDITISSRGNDVKAFQKILISKGFLPFGSDTGYFGPATFAAAKKFQIANGLPAVGRIGPATRAVLNKIK